MTTLEIILIVQQVILLLGFGGLRFDMYQIAKQINLKR